MTSELGLSRDEKYELAFYITMTSSDVAEVSNCFSLMRDLERYMTKAEKDRCTKKMLLVLTEERKVRELQEEKYNYSEIKGERTK